MIEWEKVPVVVTGGAGFIGSMLCEMLVSVGAKPRVIDNLSRGKYKNVRRMVECGRLTIQMLDLREAIPSLPDDAVVFHLAARVTNIHSNMHDHLGMLQDNLRINTNMTEALRRRPPRLAVMVSTVCVYPHDAPVPTPESAGWPLHPEETNEGYGVAKGVLEAQAKFLYRELGIPVIVPRFSNAIGRRDYYDEASSHVCAALIRRVLAGEEPLMVWGSGNQTRAFVDSRDIAKALLLLADCPEAYDAEPINIGHDREISIGDLAYLIADACGAAGLWIAFDKSRPDGHARRGVDSRRLKSLIGWAPDMPLEETIQDMVTEYARLGVDA